MEWSYLSQALGTASCVMKPLVGLWLNRALLLCAPAPVPGQQRLFFMMEVTVLQWRQKSPWSLFYTLVWSGHWHKVIA